MPHSGLARLFPVESEGIRDHAPLRTMEHGAERVELPIRVGRQAERQLRILRGFLSVQSGGRAAEAVRGLHWSLRARRTSISACIAAIRRTVGSTSRFKRSTSSVQVRRDCSTRASCAGVTVRDERSVDDAGANGRLSLGIPIFISEWGPPHVCETARPFTGSLDLIPLVPGKRKQESTFSDAACNKRRRSVSRSPAVNGLATVANGLTLHGSR